MRTPTCLFNELINPPTPWGHEACRWSLKPKPLPPLVSSHYPKLILRGEVYLSPPPLHWVVAPAFNICSDYSRSRNLMLPRCMALKKVTLLIFWKCNFLSCIFIPRRFSLEVSSVLKIAFLRFSRKSIKPQSTLMLKNQQNVVCAPKTAVGSLLFKWLLRIWRYAHQCLVQKKKMLFFV